MGQPVVHFEIIGAEPAQLRDYYGAVFGWEFDTSAPVNPAISDPTNYGFTANEGTDGIPGGVGGGEGYASRVIIYIGVPDVEVALAQAERFGGKRVMGPEKNPGKGIMIGQFTDPQGNLVGVAGPK